MMNTLVSRSLDSLPATTEAFQQWVATMKAKPNAKDRLGEGHAVLVAWRDSVDANQNGRESS